MEKQFCFDYEHYAALSELSEADRRLVAEAERATANATSKARSIPRDSAPSGR